MSVTEGVPVEELRALFTGVPIETSLLSADPWATTPCYTVPLAVEVCRSAGVDTEHGLRRVLYDDTPTDEIPQRALLVIGLAVQRYRQARVAAGRRGL